MKKIMSFENFRLSQEEMKNVTGGKIYCNVGGMNAHHRGCETLLSCAEQCVADHGDSCYGCWESIADA